jgi:hypothetical protein
VAGITLDDLLTAYREAGFTGDSGDDGATREELRRLWNCGAVKASQYLRMAQEAGILRTGWRIGKDISGRNNRIPVYSFVEPPKRRKNVRPA